MGRELLESPAMRFSLRFAVLVALVPGAAAAQQQIGVVGVEIGRATAGDADAAQRAAVALGSASGANRAWSVIEGAVAAVRECHDAPCLGALGRTHQLTHVLVLTVDREGETDVPWTVSAQLVDAQADTDLGMAQMEVAAGTADWAAGLGPGLEPLLRQLPAAEAPTGSLLVTSNVPGAEVFVDGNRVASIPMAPASVPVGARQLRVHAERYGDFLQEVRIDPGQELRIDATLAALPPPREPADQRPFYKRPWVWGVAGAVVATGVIVAIVLATSGGGDTTVEDGSVPIPPIH